MTETQTALVVGALYEVNGGLVIALTDNRVVAIDKSVSEAFEAPPNARLMYSKDSEVWADRMTQNRNAIADRLRVAQNEENRLRERYEALGAALLEQAQERDWCSDYDDFAREWDLPLCGTNFRVSVTVIVFARDENKAREMVQEEFRLSSMVDGVVHGPEYEVEEQD